MVEVLPHLNAALNSLATVLLVLGYFLIKRRRVNAHKWTMLSCFGVSALFLISYLTYHFMIEGSKKFPPYPPEAVRYFYYFVLVTHVVLAATVPVLAIITIWRGLRGPVEKHRRIARWTFPIWLYVSITGVVVYAMLYQLYPPVPS